MSEGDGGDGSVGAGDDDAGDDDAGDDEGWSAGGGVVAEPAPAAASSGREAVPASSAIVNR